MRSATAFTCSTQASSASAVFREQAEGDAARFTALLTEYLKAPDVTRRRIYIETLQDVLPGIRSKIIVDEQARSILPLLNLDRQRENQP